MSFKAGAEPKRSHHKQVAVVTQSTNMLSFFKAPPKPAPVGRPAGVLVKKRGPRPAAETAESAAVAAPAAATYGSCADSCCGKGDGWLVIRVGVRVGG